MIDRAFPHSDLAPVTVRLAKERDAAALNEVAELDGRPLGAAPLLVAESNGAVVAALSLADGTVVSDPFRYTLEAIALLRQRAAQLGGGECGSPATRALRAIKHGSARTVTIAAAVLIVLGLAATTAQAAPRPGLTPGTWVGSGIAKGADSEAGLSSTFTARLRFTIVVAKTGRISGNGKFASDIVVTGEFPSIISSTADVGFGGTPNAIAYAGTAVTRGTFGTVTRTLKPITLRQRLPITRAGACRATGSFVLNKVTFRWTAVRKIDGTCRT